MVTRLSKWMALLALAGCSWTEMPEGATAPLLVHDVTMHGELAGITIDEGRVRGEGLNEGILVRNGEVTRRRKGLHKPSVPVLNFSSHDYWVINRAFASDGLGARR